MKHKLKENPMNSSKNYIVKASNRRKSSNNRQ